MSGHDETPVQRTTPDEGGSGAAAATSTALSEGGSGETTSGGPLNVLVTTPTMGRFRDVLTGSGAPHNWTFALTGSEGAGERAAAVAATPDVLVCSSATAEVLASLPRLRLLQAASAGLDKVDLDAVPLHVVVANTYHHGPSIAEHVLMVSMMLLRRVGAAERDLRAGRWRTAVIDDTVPFGGVLNGRTMGIVGFGHIGAQVATLANAMGVRVHAVRRDPSAPLPDGVHVDWMGPDSALPELLAASDIVVVTVPLTDKTRGLIGAEAFAAMKTTAFLINVARGPIVDEQALHDALEQGAIGGAGIDVWWRNAEGPDAPSHVDFTGFDNVVLTPHQSGHTAETFEGRAREIAANIDALAAGRPLTNVVREGSTATT